MNCKFEDLPENAEELIGREFVHFKGGHYRLHGFARHTETRETMVVYEALYGDGGLWVRPAKMFFEKVTREGRTFSRFSPLTILGCLLLSALAGCGRIVMPDGGEWPEGREPQAISRRITEQFLSSDPVAYKPQGTDIAKHFPEGYGWGSGVFYATASLWVNALENARAFGDRDLEAKLIVKYRRLVAEKPEVLKPVFHVDYNVVGALPLAVARLAGDAAEREFGLKLADFQWSEPRKETEIINGNPEYAEAMRLWKEGYSGETRLWIDDMYMINLLQTQAYRLTGDEKYVDRAAKEMCLYLDKLQLENGLFYHAVDVPFVWGRGAGWMAAGMPLVLKCMKSDHPHYAKIIAGYRKMMANLLVCQRVDGLWGQLVDDPTTWAETSGSAMFAYGMAEGVAQGWLDRGSYEPAVRKAWLALCDRLDEYGNISDVCIGTNKQNDRQYYLDRGRINGDPHGQAPMLWLAGALSRMKAKTE